MSKARWKVSQVKSLSKLGSSIYLIFILQSLTQFAGIIALERTLPVEDFSQISFVLGLYAPYFLIVDLGLQASLIRRFSLTDQPAAILLPIIKIRLIAGSLATLAILVHGILGSVSHTTLLAMFLFATTYIPSGVLLSFEAWGYSEESFSKMIGLRLSRLIGFLAFTLLVVASAQIAEPSLMLAVISILSFPIVTFALAYRLWKTNQHTLFSRPLSETLSSRSLLSENRHLIASALITWLFTASFWTYCVRLFGDQGMAEINVANILTIPVALKIQIIFGLLIARRFKKKEGTKSIEPSATKVFFVITIALVSGVTTSTYCLILAIPGLLDLIFPNIDKKAIWAALVPFLASQVFIAISTYLVAEAIDQKRTGILILGPSAAFVVLALTFLAVQTLAVPQYGIFIGYLLANAAICLIYLIGTKKTA